MLATRFLNLVFATLTCACLLASNAIAAVEADPMSPDFYKRLGVERTADLAAIKAAAKKLQKKYHPDLNPGIDRVFMQNINEAYDSLAKKHLQANQPRPEESAYRQSNASVIASALNNFYRDPSSLRGMTETQLVSLFLQMGKYDFEEIYGNPKFQEIQDRFFSAEAFRMDRSNAFRQYVTGWAFYSKRHSYELNAKLFSSLDPSDSQLRDVLNGNFTSIGRDLRSQEARVRTMNLIIFEMLKQSPYIETKAGAILIDRLVTDWEHLKINRYTLDSVSLTSDFAERILKIVSEQGLNADSRFLKMASEIPMLLKIEKISFGGQFRDQKTSQLYHEVLAVYPEIFSDAQMKDPFAKALWFYKQSDSFRANDPRTELEILNWFVRIGKYDYEAIRGSSEWLSVWPLVFTSPLWNDPSNQLLDRFMGGAGFYSFRYQSTNMGLLFASLDSSNSHLRSLLYGTFAATGSDFRTQSSRIDYSRMILLGMLRSKQLQARFEVKDIQTRVDSAWREIERKSSKSYLEEEFMKQYSKQVAAYSEDVMKKAKQEAAKKAYQASSGTNSGSTGGSTPTTGFFSFNPWTIWGSSVGSAMGTATGSASTTKAGGRCESAFAN